MTKEQPEALETKPKTVPAAAGRPHLSVVLVLAAISVAALAVIKNTLREIDAFEARHQTLIELEVRESASDVESFLARQQQLVKAFAAEKQDLLAAYALDVENETLREDITTSLNRWFPSHFTFTIADENGGDLVNDVEGLVGAVCQANIQDYVRSIRETSAEHARYRSVIHPQAFNYHFDVMAPWQSGGVLRGVFFVSFYPGTLQKILHTHQTPGHFLMLLHKLRENLIEVSGDGARDKIAKNRDIRLTPDEVANIRVDRPIDGAEWRLVGFLAPGLIDDFKSSQWRQAGLLLGLMAVAALLSTWFISNNELRRQAARRELEATVVDLRASESRLEDQAAYLAKMAAEQSALREEAEAAEKTKAQFLASMSHEIRTPMNAILGLTLLALKTELSAQQRDYLTKVKSSGQSLLGLINDILDFSKIEAGKLTIELIPFRLDEVLDELTPVTAVRSSGKNLEVLFDVSTDVPNRLIGDPLRLGQILINLATNAIKFTDQGEVTLKIRPVSVDGKNVVLRFEVCDTGIGMTADQVDNLFKPFTQADASTTRRFGGTGLGLAICRTLVDLMNGEIGVESIEGRGSTFWFELPFERSSEAIVAGDIDGSDLTGLRVLVVDDYETARVLCHDAVVGLGAEAQSVASASEALEALREAKKTGTEFDVMLLDYMMPEMDGLNLVRVAQEEFGRENLPDIVFVTAFDQEDIRQSAISLGIEVLLSKPVHPSRLHRVVNSFRSKDDKSAHGGTEAGHSTDHRLRGARVLLVEDNEINQQVAQELLEGVGVEVQIAENGKAAVEMSVSGRYDAVLMDIQMPVMDGYEATARIREDRLLQDIPIIAMTAHAMASERDRCLAAGMNDHVTKPIDPDRLFNALARWVKPKSDSGQSAAPERPAESSPSPDPAPEQAPNVQAKPEPGSGSETQSQTNSPPPGGLPDDIAGIDMEAARTMMRGNDALLGKLLTDFRDKYLDKDQEIRDALEAGDIETAARTAHSLKGVGGNIRAREVFETVAAKDDLLRDDPENPQVYVLLDELTARLTALKTSLGAALPSEQ